MKKLLIVLICVLLIGCREKNLPIEITDPIHTSKKDDWKYIKAEGSVPHKEYKIKWVALVSPCDSRIGMQMNETNFDTEKECLNYDYSNMCDNYKYATCYKMALRKN